MCALEFQALSFIAQADRLKQLESNGSLFTCDLSPHGYQVEECRDTDIELV
jgi:hypothetical protein